VVVGSLVVVVGSLVVVVGTLVVVVVGTLVVVVVGTLVVVVGFSFLLSDPELVVPVLVCAPACLKLIGLKLGSFNPSVFNFSKRWDT